jgi:hypothetical protein
MWYIIFLIIGFIVGIYTPKSFSDVVKDKTTAIFKWFKNLFSKDDNPVV